MRKTINKINFKTLFSFALLILSITAAETGLAQTKLTETINFHPGCDLLEKNEESFLSGTVKTEKCAALETEPEKGGLFLPENEPPIKTQSAAVESETRRGMTDTAKVKTKNILAGKDTVQPNEKFHWKSALIESGIFLGIKHGVRLTQAKTTRELGGPFFRDWANSVKNLRGWNDGDSPFTNNFAHPLQGGATGRIFINNSDRAKRLEFGKSKDYWESRMKAMAWSAVWSTQFEFGPFSEASIGNVGLRQKNGHSTMAWTDLVLTPVVGTGVLVGEDAIDRYILKNWLERKAGNKATTKIKFLRSVLTPTTAFSNLLRGKVPWKRNNR